MATLYVLLYSLFTLFPTFLFTAPHTHTHTGMHILYTRCLFCKSTSSFRFNLIIWIILLNFIHLIVTHTHRDTHEYVVYNIDIFWACRLYLDYNNSECISKAIRYNMNGQLTEIYGETGEKYIESELVELFEFILCQKLSEFFLVVWEWEIESECMWTQNSGVKWWCSFKMNGIIVLTNKGLLPYKSMSIEASVYVIIMCGWNVSVIWSFLHRSSFRTIKQTYTHTHIHTHARITQMK